MTSPPRPAPLAIDRVVVERGAFRVGPASFEVAAGDALAVVGPNGSGKSTLLLGILGLLVRSAGTVAINGAPVDRRHPPASTGALLSWPGFYDWVSGRRNLRLAAEGDRPALARIDGLLAEVGLVDAADRPVRAYSTGMAKRLELARALLFDPSLLVLDEPTSGLDDDGCAWLTERLSAHRGAGRALLVATHDHEFVVGLGARVVRLDRGVPAEPGAVAR